MAHDYNGKGSVGALARGEDRIPPEPPEGTWVMDRFEAVSQRRRDGDGLLGWGMPGFYSTGVWEQMWEARGPLIECSPWGTVEKEAQREQHRAADRERLVREVEEARKMLDWAEQRLADHDLNLGPRQ